MPRDKVMPDIVKKARKSAGLTVEEAANKVQVGEATWRGWESAGKPYIGFHVFWLFLCLTDQRCMERES